MYKLIRVIFLAAILLLTFPTAAYAQDGCSGIACWFNWDLGWTDRAQIKADAEVEIAQEETEQTRIEQAELTRRQEQETRLQNEHTARLEEIKRQADMAIAEAQSRSDIAQAQKDQFIAQVENWRDIQNKAINADLDKALASINGTINIGLKSLEEAGETKRWALTTDMIGWLAAFSLIAIGIYFWTQRTHAPQYTINVLPAPRDRLPDQRQALPGHVRYPVTVVDDNEVEGGWHYEYPQQEIGQQHRITNNGGNNAITPRNGGEHW